MLAPRKRAARQKTDTVVSTAPTTRVGQSAFQTALIRPPIFPTHQLVRGQLYYNYQQTLTAAAGAPNTQIYGANFMFDPDVSGVGHQPMGFDQLMLVYEHFAVIHSSCSVTFSGSGSNGVFRAGVYLSPDAVALSNPNQIMENGLNNSTAIDGKDTGVARSKTITLDCDVTKYFGKQRWHDIMDDEKLTGSATADPIEGVYYNVVGWQINAAGTWSVTYDILLSYDVVYFEPRKLASS